MPLLKVKIKSISKKNNLLKWTCFKITGTNSYTVKLQNILTFLFTRIIAIPKLHNKEIVAIPKLHNKGFSIFYYVHSQLNLLPALITFGKIHFLLIPENEFLHEIKHDGIISSNEHVSK